MKIVKEESEKSTVLTLGVADNTLAGPAEAIKFTITELLKAGHTIHLYTYFPDDLVKMTALKEFVEKDLGFAGLEVRSRKTIDADIWFDENNYGGCLGWFSLFGSFLNSGLIAPSQKNIRTFQDTGFWHTGKETSGIITEAKNTPKKLILPGGKSNGTT